VKLILFHRYIYKVSFHTLSTVHLGTLCGTQNISRNSNPSHAPARMCQVEDLQPSVILHQIGVPSRCLGAQSSLAWPPRSPDITPLDFFLWGYVKDNVCATEVTEAEHLKTKIRDVITTINTGMLARSWEELEFRLDVTRATQNGHIELCRVYEKLHVRARACLRVCVCPSQKISLTFFLVIYVL
jgi:hypothetical protein